jgi:hypothetical protein
VQKATTAQANFFTRPLRTTINSYDRRPASACMHKTRAHRGAFATPAALVRPLSAAACSLNATFWEQARGCTAQLNRDGAGGADTRVRALRLNVSSREWYHPPRAGRIATREAPTGLRPVCLAAEMAPSAYERVTDWLERSSSGSLGAGGNDVPGGSIQRIFSISQASSATRQAGRQVGTRPWSAADGDGEATGGVTGLSCPCRRPHTAVAHPVGGAPATPILSNAPPNQPDLLSSRPTSTGQVATLLACQTAACMHDDYYDTIPEDSSVHDGDLALAAIGPGPAASSAPMATAPGQVPTPRTKVARGSINARALADPSRHIVRQRPAQMMDRHYKLAKAQAPQPVYEPGDKPEGGAPLTTSAQVLAYIVQHGQAAQKHLFYLNRRVATSALDIPSPFELVVVRREQRKANHFTMTLMGVSEFHEDHESEFTPLGVCARSNSSTVQFCDRGNRLGAGDKHIPRGMCIYGPEGLVCFTADQVHQLAPWPQKTVCECAGEWIRLCTACDLTVHLPFFRAFRCAARP